MLLLEGVISILFLVGAVFILVGGIGMVRLPDLYMRLHAPSTTSTLGLGCFVLAGIVYSGAQGRLSLAGILLLVLVFITAPVSANLLAQAALHLKLRSRSGEVPESLARPRIWKNIKWERRPKKNEH